MRVIVCILTDDPHSQKVTKLYTCFEHDIFKVQVYNIIPNTNVISDSKLTKEGLYQYRFNYCLRDVAKNHANNYMIVIRDDVLCANNTNTLAGIIKDAINITTDNWDVLYLSAWGDDCKNYHHVADVTGHNMYIAKTPGPKGSNAFMLSPTGRNKMIMTNKNLPICTILKNEIEDGTMNGLIVVPTPMLVDPTGSDVGYKQVNLQQAKYADEQSGIISPINAAWFFIIAIAVALLVWVMVSFKNK